MAVATDFAQLDKSIKATVKAFKQASAVQVWTWETNRERNLQTIIARLEELAAAGKLQRVENSFPAAYKMGRWR